MPFFLNAAATIDGAVELCRHAPRPTQAVLLASGPLRNVWILVSVRRLHSWTSHCEEGVICSHAGCTRVLASFHDPRPACWPVLMTTTKVWSCAHGRHLILSWIECQSLCATPGLAQSSYMIALTQTHGCRSHSTEFHVVPGLVLLCSLKNADDPKRVDAVTSVRGSLRMACPGCQIPPPAQVLTVLGAEFDLRLVIVTYSDKTAHVPLAALVKFFGRFCMS